MAVRPHRGSVCGAVVLTLVLAAQFAWAERRRGIVIESHLGGRSVDLQQLVPPLIGELDSAGFYAHAREVTTVLERRHSQRGQSLSVKSVVRVNELVARAWNSWGDVRFRDILGEANEAVELMMSRPATLVTRPMLRPVLYKAYVLLALANKRLGNPSRSDAAMDELVRTFPGKFDWQRYGPEALAIYKQRRKALNKRGKGVLRIKVSPASAKVFVNGTFLSQKQRGGVKLYPGTYWVHTRTQVPGRLHKVVVKPNVVTSAHIRHSLDSMLHTGEDFVGLMLPQSANRYKAQNRYAIEVGKAAEVPLVVVINVDLVRGKVALVGTVLQVSRQQIVRMAAVEVKPRAPTWDTLRNFGQFLAGTAKAESGVRVLSAEDRAELPSFRPIAAK